LDSRVSRNRAGTATFKHKSSEGLLGNHELLEKAFALADSGEVASISELRRALIEGGITMIELQQFHGRALVRQLRERIAKSRKRYQVGVPLTRQ
jgi:hypothetical protein